MKRLVEFGLFLFTTAFESGEALVLVLKNFSLSQARQCVKHAK